MDIERSPCHFTIAKRQFEWHEIGYGASVYRWIDVRSGDFAVRIAVFGNYPNWVWLGPLVVLGSEFPPGRQAQDPPYILSFRSYDRDRHGLVHSELVKSVIQRFCDSKKSKRRPLTADFRAANMLPLTEWPESKEERLARETVK